MRVRQWCVFSCHVGFVLRQYDYDHQSRRPKRFVVAILVVSEQPRSSGVALANLPCTAPRSCRSTARTRNGNLLRGSNFKIGLVTGVHVGPGLERLDRELNSRLLLFIVLFVSHC